MPAYPACDWSLSITNPITSRVRICAHLASSKASFPKEALLAHSKAAGLLLFPPAFFETQPHFTDPFESNRGLTCRAPHSTKKTPASTAIDTGARPPGRLREEPF
jgi:hypothetical protein